jgi:hypothetical protein
MPVASAGWLDFYCLGIDASRPLVDRFESVFLSIPPSVMTLPDVPRGSPAHHRGVPSDRCVVSTNSTRILSGSFI